MAVTINRETEVLLREQAERMGQNADGLADALLRNALAEADRDFREACVAIAEALAIDPAHDVPLEQYRTQFEAERDARRLQRAGRR